MAKNKKFNDETRQIIWNDVDKDLIKHKYTFPHKDCPAEHNGEARYFSPTKHGNLWCRPNAGGCGETVPYNSFKGVWDNELQIDVPDVYKFVKKRWRESEDLKELITLRAPDFKKERDKRYATQKKNFKKVKTSNIIKLGNKTYELKEIKNNG
tara:strand:+ start:497 stop:955 length:459 start_codon:yes stop_codon:yes gene_type:complete